MDLKLYLALAGSLGVAYLTYNIYNKPRTVTISLDLTRRICQEIKHQMLIACISYSKAMKKIREEIADKIKGKEEQINLNFRNELSQIYVSKQTLILKKYAVTRQTYGKALEKFKKDKLLLKNTEQIIAMMERAISGLLPDFTIPAQAHQAFNKEQLAEIYKEMVTLIAKKVTHKLQEEVDKNKHFNPNSDEDFRNAIRQLGIYDIKVDYLKRKGFKEEWGCPNEVFFKYLEGEKSKNEVYQKTITAYEKCYEQIIELVSIDPKKMNDRKIHEMFDKALTTINTSTVPSKPAISPILQPARIAPVQAPKTFVPPSRPVKKSEPVDEDAELEAMMMQQLLSRSQQPMRSVSAVSSLGESLKLGMTSSEIQNDWEKNASFTEKPVDKFEEAKDEVAIGLEDSKLIKQEMRVVEEALREQEVEEKTQIKENEGEQEAQLEESNVEASNVEEKVESNNEEPSGLIVDVEPVAKVEETEKVESNNEEPSGLIVDVEPVAKVEETVVVVQSESVVVESVPVEEPVSQEGVQVAKEGNEAEQ